MKVAVKSFGIAPKTKRGLADFWVLTTVERRFARTGPCARSGKKTPQVRVCELSIRHRFEQSVRRATNKKQFFNDAPAAAEFPGQSFCRPAAPSFERRRRPGAKPMPLMLPGSRPYSQAIRPALTGPRHRRGRSPLGRFAPAPCRRAAAAPKPASKPRVFRPAVLPPAENSARARFPSIKRQTIPVHNDRRSISNERTVLEVTAKPIPIKLRSCFMELVATPITRPSVFSIGASDIPFSTCASVVNTSKPASGPSGVPGRIRPLTRPSVKVGPRPNGNPMVTSLPPVTIASESPNERPLRLAGASSSSSSATSAAGSDAKTRAVARRPSQNTILISSAACTR